MEESVCIVLGRGQDLEMQREIGQFGFAIQHKVPNHSTESLTADFSAIWSASERPIFPYNSGTEARIEAPQAPERAR